MIFAELIYDAHYSDIHEPLLNHLKTEFAEIESGHQGDSWIWVFDGDEKVAIDTFSSMKHQIKSDKPDSSLLQIVIEAIQKKYQLTVFPQAELEAHEE